MSLKYKKTETISLNLKGFIDPVDMTIDINGEFKKLSTLLSDFADAFVELSVKTKNEEELDEPVEIDEDNE